MTKRIVLLQALASTPRKLARMLTGVNESTPRQRPVPDQWSITDVLNHLVNVEERYLDRLQRVVQEERPLLPAILPDEAASYPQATLDELMTRFENARAETLAFFKELSPEDWQRPAIHERKGETCFLFLVKVLVDHDIEHLNQIVEMLQQLRTLPPLNPQPKIRTYPSQNTTPHEPDS
jgi:uncharacterized damage-inducible protein DinB